MNGHALVWGSICPFLLGVLLLSGCDYGDRNRDPVTIDDAATTARQVPVTINALANDSDPDGDPVSLVAWTQGANGVVTRNDDGTLTYAPAEGFDGTDHFTYTVDDDHGGQATGTVTATVLPNHGAVVDGTLYVIRRFTPAGFVDATAWGMNDRGQIVGSGLSGDGSEFPFFLDVNGDLVVIEIPALPGRAIGINNNGLVSGFFFMAAEDEPSGHLEAETDHDQDHDHDHNHDEDGALIGHSFLWDANTRSLVALYEIEGALATLGRKINDLSQVVGQVEFVLQDEENDAHGHNHEHDHDHADDDDHDDHEPHDTQSLGFMRQVDGSTSTFTIPGSRDTLTGGLNNRGHIVGGFTVDDGSGRPLTAFLHHADGTVTTFNVLDDDGSPLPTQAEDIDDAGIIVGYFTHGSHEHDHDQTHDEDADHDHDAEDEPVQPFLRTATGAIFRFSLPDATQARFSDINNQGVISGFSVGADGARQALVLSPVLPAPNTRFGDTALDGEDHEHDHAH